MLYTDILVGSTGFVGTNLASSHSFTAGFHSRNITEAFGAEPDLLVYAGVRAEMFLANKNPGVDQQHINAAIDNICRIAPKEVVLISTVAVYSVTHEVDEDFPMETEQLSAYGANRLALERWVENNCEKYLIVRLPAIFGKNLKKNFLYDFIHIIPPMLTDEKLRELSLQAPQLTQYYKLQENGFWKCKQLSFQEEVYVKELFRKLEFSALNFTDSRSIYQFYDLNHLWNHISVAREADIHKVNLVPPPLSVADVYHALTGNTFCNELSKPPFAYDIRTKYDAIFGGTDGYILSKRQELDDILRFVQEEC